jgi:Rrf2 family iron-sulfur cluster assembly transcriptional regulator
MRLTTRGRYAVTAMLDLALHAGEGPVTLAEISRRQDISLSYLEQLFAKLRKKGLVCSTRGPGGGYSLCGGADAVAVGDIIRAVDESVDATSCRGSKNCQQHQRCLTHDLWADLSTQIDNFLGGISLGDLLQRRRVKEVSLRQDEVFVRQQAGSHG